ncbi:MAG: hypothetical protein EOP55_09380 [Sphingobacteriales bacterium]|nr:MAG: hypothetical protein EOP55_09380 [Sphingobacteriales bacterium]
MNKLTLEELAPYLPYNLLISTPLWVTDIRELTTENFDRVTSFWNTKAILRPIDEISLDEVIEHTDDHDEIMQAFKDDTLLYVRHDLFIILVKNHFDVFGLIEKDLAIDINSIPSEKRKKARNE